MQIVNPATGAVLDEVPETTVDGVAAAYETARAGQPAWAARPLPERIDAVRRFAASVEAQRDQLAPILTAETGKPIAQAAGEITATLARIEFFVDHVTGVTADQVVHESDGLREVIRREPLGVVANISAWNYPWFVGTNVFVPALLCGNAVLYKPSEYATRTGLAIADLLHAAGVPEPVFAALPGGGATGAALLDQPIDAVFFTGSHPTGRRIAEAVAGRMVKVQLELGGKDPVYVADDVDVTAAAAALADGAFYNNGQSCCAVERIYVHEAVHDEFVEAFVAEVERFAMGDPTDPTTYLGPLTRPQQAEVLAAQVADAVDRGAIVRTGGGVLDDRGGPAGAWFAPTVLTGVDNIMVVFREESFGPVIGIASVPDDDAAVAAMDDTEYGLTAGVFTTDEERARRVLDRLDVGSAYWNCCDRVSPTLPWTGRRHSGIGSTLSVEGISTFTRPKAYHLRRP
ncbi:MAG: aldehyde dehydrogenase family protein [Acidimicrobiia bacterium]|nr:aldehyde dehydrogenase family protein [Acidimicrobiia bacterium]